LQCLSSQIISRAARHGGMALAHGPFIFGKEASQASKPSSALSAAEPNAGPARPEASFQPRCALAYPNMMDSIVVSKTAPFVTAILTTARAPLL